MALTSINPATGDTVAEFDEHSADEVERRLSASAEAFGDWSARSVSERAPVLSRMAGLLEAERDAMAGLMTLEMGKIFRAARDEVTKCAVGCRYYAEHAATITAAIPVEDEGMRHGEVRFEPLGAVLAVMPWNFPFWQVIRFAAPALAAGNVALLKHASNVPQCAMALEDLWRRAGVPDAAFQTLLIGSSRVEAIVADSRVAAVTLTGSEGAGRAVAMVAGRHLKKTVLELGGSDPFIVTPSANLELAVKAAVDARIINNGQSCIAAKRFIVLEEIAEEFTARFVLRMSALKVGDPMLPNTDVGPLATAAIRDELQAQVQETVSRGAEVLLGGAPLAGPGWFYAPTVLADIPRGSPAREQELFGPVASVFRVPSVDAAIALANDSTFGLGASAWTTDAVEAERFARGLDAGSVFINGIVASDPRYPFGGVKHSGYGRELGAWGLREFVNIKTVRRFVDD
ncbi:MAG TPA: NAD-dependent succinate-semialdehyde dehydrogenase [Gemmatimonadaceae bacterium]|nr:NAD-dependent succinate-semialdehyde dehydrogenase [Gemmatimonadaceae bacterium]